MGSGPSRTRRGLVLVMCVWFGARLPAARAQTVEQPTVVRGQGAEACPDAAALGAQIAAIGGLADAFSRSGYTVEFAHAAALGGTFSARIRTRDAASERLLQAPGGSCAPLAKATAVTLALLLDNELRSEPAPPPDPAAATPLQASSELPAAPETQEPTAVVRSPADDQDTSTRVARPRRIDRAALGLGAAGLFGVVRTLTPALLGQLSVERGRLQLGLGALWALPHTRELAPGTLDAKLASGLFQVCVGALESHVLRLSACSGAYAGVLTVEAHGFTRDDTRHEAWLAIPLEFTLATLWSPIGLSLTAGALFPIRRHDFSIDGLGKAFRSWPVAALLALRLELGWFFSRERSGSHDTRAALPTRPPLTKE